MEKWGLAGTRSVHHTASALTVGGSGYTWDAAGRVAGKGDWTLQYGANGQLAHASRPGREVDFVYDDADQRLLKRVDGAPVRADVAGGVLTEDHFVELVIVGGVVAGVLDNGTFTALWTDPRGTPFAGPDGTPGLASPYGVRASHLGYAEAIDYTRLGWDPDLDVVRMGVRDYDARLSQFLVPDPLYFEHLEKCQSSPLQCTLYGYAGGNPISFVDPTGLGFRDWVARAGAVWFGISSGIVDAITFDQFSKRVYGEENVEKWNQVSYYHVAHVTSEAATDVALIATGAGEVKAALKAGQVGLQAMRLSTGGVMIVAGARTVQAAQGAAAVSGGVTSLLMSAMKNSSGSSGSGRSRNNLKPDPTADGSHTTFKRDPQTGKVTGHAEWDAHGNPVKRTDVTGADHGPVKTPHTHEYGPPNVDPKTGTSYPGNEVRVRPATPDEIPR